MGTSFLVYFINFLRFNDFNELLKPFWNDKVRTYCTAQSAQLLDCAKCALIAQSKIFIKLTKDKLIKSEI